MKYKFGENLDKKQNDGKEGYEAMLNKYVDVKKGLDEKIGMDLADQEDNFARKKRERRERSISKSMDIGRKKKNKEDEEGVDTTNLLGNLAGDNDRKKNLESGEFDNPF